MKQLKVTLLGGGTGLSVLARGLKSYPVDITAIVTVADDGGSTGRIRDKIDMPAPGDIRNVMGAMSDVEQQLSRLFRYRFKQDELDGHALGNLMIAAMYDMTGDFASAVRELSKLLNIKGEIIPSTNVGPKLVARMSDNSLIVGESYIPKVEQKIEEVYLSPRDIDATPEAMEAIKQSDIIVFGPGSLYTSIIPNILPKGMKEAIQASDGVKVFVCNIMTQRGETKGYSALDHIDAIEYQMGAKTIDEVILNTKEINQKISVRYKEQGLRPVSVDIGHFKARGIKTVTHEHLFEINEDGIVRHDNAVLAELIYNIALEETSTIEYKKN